jgi:hypothetical protein
MQMRDERFCHPEAGAARRGTSRARTVTQIIFVAARSGSPQVSDAGDWDNALADILHPANLSG